MGLLRLYDFENLMNLCVFRFLVKNVSGFRISVLLFNYILLCLYNIVDCRILVLCVIFVSLFSLVFRLV